MRAFVAHKIKCDATFCGQDHEQFSTYRDNTERCVANGASIVKLTFITPNTYFSCCDFRQ